MTVMSLREWATQRGIAVTSAYRYARKGDRKSLHLPPHASLRRTPTGRWIVDLDPETTRQRETSKDLIARLDPDQLADWLTRHGYVLLTLDEAQQLGVTRGSIRGRPQRTDSHEEDREEEREGQG
jgi:hypothetical protein